jgi:hypothetical protein
MMTFPTVSGKSESIPWFQKKPTTSMIYLVMVKFDVRFPEGKHGKHPNIINSTMKSRFPKWKAPREPTGPWSPIASVHLPGGPGIAQKNPGVLQ